jgi:C-terminal processing protease CtpA/Prc
MQKSRPTLVVLLCLFSLPFVACSTSAQPTPTRRISNLRALAKVYGYARYFYPANSVRVIDWDDFLYNAIPEVEKAKDDKSLAEVLERHIQTITPGLTINDSRTSPSMPRILHDSKKVQRWEHFGMGNEDDTRSTYRSMLVSRESSHFDSIPWMSSRMISRELIPGLYAHWPLAIDPSDTLWSPTAVRIIQLRSALAKVEIKHRTTWVAGVIKAWNVFQHFYPYFDVVKPDWDGALSAALTKVNQDSNYTDYFVTLRQLTAKLRDAHIFVNGKRGFEYTYSAPIIWEMIENKLVITHVEDPSTGLEVGDVVTSINDRPVLDVFRERALEISSSTKQYENARVPLALRAGGREPELKFTIEGKSRSFSFPAGEFKWVEEDRGAKIREVADNVWYIDLTRINDSQFDSMVTTLSKASGIIFDIRGYPADYGVNRFGHLTDTAMTCAQWHIPMITKPDQEDMKFNFSNWQVMPRKPRFKARVAFITNGTAVSYAETVMGIVEHYKLGEIVGEGTTGTNGNVNTFKVPGDYTISFTGMKVLKHDGSQHHGIGILPTYPVSRTIAAIKAGRDEYLEKAIEVVSRP